MRAAEEATAGCGRPPRGPPGQATLKIVAPLRRREIPQVCERVRILLEDSGAEVVICDVGAWPRADLGAVDLIAGVCLTARRLRREVRLHRVSPDLAALLAFLGLGELVPCELVVEPCGQAEQREQRGGVEEGVHRDDLPT